MFKRPFQLVLLASLGLALAATSAFGQDESQSQSGRKGGGFDPTQVVQHFATLPQRADPTTNGPLGHPEGVCADKAGNVYANTFELAAPNFLYAFGRDGQLKATVAYAPGVVPLGCAVGLGKLFVNDVFSGKEIMFELPLSDSSVPETTFSICGGFTPFNGNDPSTFCALNANVVGPDGRVYISDNGDQDFGFNKGRVWVLDPITNSAMIFIDPPELDVPTTHPLPKSGYQSFGVNGVAISNDKHYLYMANMSASKIYKLELNRCWAGCEPGHFTLFFSNPDAIKGPDNMDFDDDGNLWIASGQNDHVVALDRWGKVKFSLGSFQGFTADGAPKNLLQPSGVIVTRGHLYIGNEANITLRPAQGSDYTLVDWGKLKLFTISQVDLKDLERGNDHHDGW